MKILVVQDWLRSGGTERQSVFLCGAFAQAGHDVTLLTFRPGGRLVRTLPSWVHHAVLQPFDTKLDWFAPGLMSRATREQPDVVLCMGRMANCYAGALQEALPAAAVIGTMRTGKKLPWLFRRSLRTVRHVVANSHEARQTLIVRYNIAAEKVSVIHNSLVFAPATDDARQAARALRNTHRADEATLVLLCVAMFRPEKNQRELVEIVAGLPADTRYQLWLAGDGPARAACERRAEALGLGERVRFVGYHRDPTPLYAAADVAVHASWSEALSNFLIEAQAHGLPVVAYAAQGVRECFMPDRTGWAIARDDREAFRARLLALMNEPQQARQLRADEARAYARATFDPQRQVDAFLELFDGLK